MAVALSGCDVTVRDLTLRTPTLDDVFLELTGNRFEHDESTGGRIMTVAAATLRSQAAAVEPRAAGFLADTATIAGRALRAIPRDVETVIPPIFIALFFFLVNIGTLSDLTEGQIAGFDFTAFQLPTAILLGVTGVSRAPALVLDVQNGYFDRLLLTPGAAAGDPARPHGRRRRPWPAR